MKKKIGKKILSILLVAVMLLGIAPFKGLGNLFVTTANALTEGYYTYTVDGGFATITGVDDSISGDVIIPSTLGGYTVAHIDSWAFYGCSSLTGIDIPDSVTVIDSSAFRGCVSLANIEVGNDNQKYSSVDGVLFNKEKTELIQYPIGNIRTSYTVPDGVTSVGSSAFENCSSLTSIDLPDSLTSIGSSAFEDCSSLTSIDLPDSLTIIGYAAFRNCSSLTGIDIPDSVTSIDDVFGGCVSLANIEVGNDNQKYSSVDGVLFNKEKTELIQYPIGNIRASYTVPDGVTSIGSSAFADCSSLTSIDLPDSLTIIGYAAFRNCSSLTGIDIPDGVTSIDDDVFGGCVSLANIEVSNDNRKYSSVDGVLFNKAKTELIQYPIGNTRTNYTVPDSVTSIGNRAFSSCESLTSIIIPDSVTSIGWDAFYDTCYYNDDSNWENDVLYIDNHLIEAVSYSISGDYEIKDGTKTIANSAFACCDSLTSITIPDSVTSIGEGAFSSCESLTSIILPDSVTSIGVYAFYDTGYYNDDSNWENDVLYIDNHLIEAVSYSISGDYEIKDGTKTIANSAFAYCDSLTSITIPDSVTSIGDDAFGDCYSLTSVTLGNGVTSIGDRAFYWCTSITSVVIPDSVTRIGDDAFGGCYNLTSVTLGNGVTSIGDRAFYWCESITSVVIPDSVTRIGDDAFGYCYSLTSVTLGNGVTSIGTDAFLGCDSSLTIFGIPGSYAETYANENGINFSPIGGGDVLTPAAGSDCVIDKDSDTIYGLEPGITKERFESSFVKVGSGYSLQYSSTVMGTGTVVNVVNNENSEVVETYTIIIFGDTNGSGTINSLDALKALQAAVGKGTLTEIEKTAGDIDGNGTVTSIDALKILQCATGIRNINQTNPSGN